MEDYAIDIIIGKRALARSMRISLPHFTLVGTTTRLTQLAPAFRDRFGSIHYLIPYDQLAMSQIVLRTAKHLGVIITEDGACEVANWANGDPQAAKRLLKYARDYAQVRANRSIDSLIVREALRQFSVDPIGADKLIPTVKTFLDSEIEDAVESAHASRYIPEAIRRAVWERDRGCCVRCGEWGRNADLEFDHVIPHSKGGANTATNLQLLCRNCNNEKSDHV